MLRSRHLACRTHRSCALRVTFLQKGDCHTHTRWALSAGCPTFARLMIKMSRIWSVRTHATFKQLCVLVSKKLLSIQQHVLLCGLACVTMDSMAQKVKI